MQLPPSSGDTVGSKNNFICCNTFFLFCVIFFLLSFFSFGEASWFREASGLRKFQQYTGELGDLG